MKGAITAVLFLLTISCNDFAGYDVNKAALVLANKSTISETEEVLSMIPLSYIAAGDSLLACIVDYRSLALYNIYSGALQQSVRIDSALIRSGFSNARYIQENCLNKYDDRNYILSQDSISSIGMPLLEIIKVVPPFVSLDSLTLLVKVLTPYMGQFMYKGSMTDLIWAATSPMLLSYNLNQKSINKITPVNESLVEKNNDKSEAAAVYLVPDFGCLLYGRRFYTKIGPGAHKFRPIAEACIFDLNNTASVRYDSYKYPARYSGYASRRIMTKEFQVGNNNRIWSNSMYDIYTIDAPGQEKKVLPLKHLLDSTHGEYINSFYTKDEKNYLIQTVTGDSGNAAFNFRFYNAVSGTISSCKLSKPRKTTAVTVAYHKNNVLFITNDDEHYYIENYKIEEP